jgi:hypothetical protein
VRNGFYEDGSKTTTWEVICILDNPFKEWYQLLTNCTSLVKVFVPSLNSSQEMFAKTYILNI